MPPAPAIPLGFGRRSASSEPAQCPCGGGAYNRCCGPLIAGEQVAVTAQQLMRSRFSAFALAARDPQAIEHLLRTHPEAGQTAAARRKALMESCRTIEWLSLKVLDFQNGGPLDQHGSVTLKPAGAIASAEKACSRSGPVLVGESPASGSISRPSASMKAPRSEQDSGLGCGHQPSFRPRALHPKRHQPPTAAPKKPQPTATAPGPAGGLQGLRSRPV